MSGKIIEHKKARLNYGEVAEERTVKGKFRYNSFCLGITEESISKEQAKCILSGMGWVTYDDVAEVIGEKKIREVIASVDKKYKF